MAEQLAQQIYDLFIDKIGGELLAFITSLLPILECRGGMIIAKLCDIPFIRAFLLCYLGNMIPIPFILLFIKQIFKFMKKHNILTGFIAKLEGKTARNQEKVMRYKQWGLLLFIAIPLPGTGGWTGSLIAALLHVSRKKSVPAIFIGLIMATVIMCLLFYGGLHAILN